MSRRNSKGEADYTPREFTVAEAQAIEEGLDCQMIEHVKELLRALWKQGRISGDASDKGMMALALACDAVEHPGQKERPWTDGARLLTEQHFAKQECDNEPF